MRIADVLTRYPLPPDPDQKLRDLCRQGISAGWSCFKIKVGRDIDDDIRRCTIIREEIGWDRRMMVDANQVRFESNVPPKSGNNC